MAKVSFGGKEAAKVNKIVKRKLEAVEMGRRGGYSFYKGKILRQERRRGCPNCHKMSISRVKKRLAGCRQAAVIGNGADWGLGGMQLGRRRVENEGTHQIIQFN